SAITAAQRLLKDAKERSRPGLGVAVLNRGGQRARVVLPWHDSGAVTGKLMIVYLETLAAAISGPLSGRLAAGLETDRVALAELSRDWLGGELTPRGGRPGGHAARGSSRSGPRRWEQSSPHSAAPNRANAASSTAQTAS